MAAIGPAGATRQDAIEATDHKINTRTSPRGWKIRIVNWRQDPWTGVPRASNPKLEEAWETLSGPLALAKLTVSPVGNS